MEAAGTEPGVPGPPRAGGERFAGLKAWLPLLVLQALVAGLVLFPFIHGDVHFAFLDIGSDTYVVSANHMHFARMFAREGFSGWSFGFGLGAPVPFAFNDVIGQLSGLAGPQHVLQLRIWVYLLKIAAAGAFFFLFARGFVARRETALIAALAYSFCGYIVTNGTWDSESDIFVFAPLVLLGIQRCLRTGDLVTLPVALGAMLLCGVFFLLAGVSLLVAFGVCVAAAPEPRAMARRWLTRVFPLAALGFVLGAPYALPMALQLLDSPRISGAGSMLARVAQQGFAVSDGLLLLAQLGGLFHKDIFGIGGMHDSYMNYLESPGFYVGVLPLLLLPQLWRGSAADRRMLVVGGVAIAAYIVLPVFRLAAFGFAAPYFRGTTLWVSLGLLLLGARALDQVFTRGVDRRMLAVGAAAAGLALALVAWIAPVSPNHVMKIAVVMGVWVAVFALAGTRLLVLARLPALVVALLAVELVAIVWPSYFVMRVHAAPDQNPFDDVAIPALEAVRADRPPPFYRVEKTFESFSHADSVAQDYRGVKSYYYHGSAVVQFHQGMDLMHEFKQRPTNYTNWLPGPGDRFMLQSALGVRYVISKEALDWPGLERMAAGPGYFVYRNELALPLGVVHTKQVTAAELAKLSTRPLSEARWVKDLVLINAVVLDELQPRWGAPFDLAGLLAKGEIDTLRHYALPAQALQRTGLQVTHFSDDRIGGTIRPEQPGILVFTIPAYDGWSLRIDGQPVPLMKADFGLLAAPVAAGAHDVELTYTLPGLRAGLLLGLAAAAVLALLGFASRRGRRR